MKCTLALRYPLALRPMIEMFVFAKLAALRLNETKAWRSSVIGIVKTECSGAANQSEDCKVWKSTSPANALALAGRLALALGYCEVAAKKSNAKEECLRDLLRSRHTAPTRVTMKCCPLCALVRPLTEYPRPWDC